MERCQIQDSKLGSAVCVSGCLDACRVTDGMPGRGSGGRESGGLSGEGRKEQEKFWCAGGAGSSLVLRKRNGQCPVGTFRRVDRGDNGGVQWECL